MYKLLPLLLLVACTTENINNDMDEYVLAHNNCSTYAEHIWLCNELTPKYIYIEYYKKNKCPRQPPDENGLEVVKCTALDTPDYLF